MVGMMILLSMIATVSAIQQPCNVDTDCPGVEFCHNDMCLCPYNGHDDHGIWSMQTVTGLYGSQHDMNESSLWSTIHECRHIASDFYPIGSQLFMAQGILLHGCIFVVSLIALRRLWATGRLSTNIHTYAVLLMTLHELLYFIHYCRNPLGPNREIFEVTMISYLPAPIATSLYNVALLFLRDTTSTQLNTRPAAIQRICCLIILSMAMFAALLICSVRIGLVFLYYYIAWAIYLCGSLIVSSRMARQLSKQLEYHKPPLPPQTEPDDMEQLHGRHHGADGAAAIVSPNAAGNGAVNGASNAVIGRTKARRTPNGNANGNGNGNGNGAHNPNDPNHPQNCNHPQCVGAISPVNHAHAEQHQNHQHRQLQQSSSSSNSSSNGDVAVVAESFGPSRAVVRPFESASMMTSSQNSRIKALPNRFIAPPLPPRAIALRQRIMRFVWGSVIWVFAWLLIILLGMLFNNQSVTIQIAIFVPFRIMESVWCILMLHTFWPPPARNVVPVPPEVAAAIAAAQGAADGYPHDLPYIGHHHHMQQQQIEMARAHAAAMNAGANIGVGMMMTGNVGAAGNGPYPPLNLATPTSSLPTTPSHGRGHGTPSHGSPHGIQHFQQTPPRSGGDPSSMPTTPTAMMNNGGYAPSTANMVAAAVAAARIRATIPAAAPPPLISVLRQGNPLPPVPEVSRPSAEYLSSSAVTESSSGSGGQHRDESYSDQDHDHEESFHSHHGNGRALPLPPPPHHQMMHHHHALPLPQYHSIPSPMTSMGNASSTTPAGMGTANGFIQQPDGVQGQLAFPLSADAPAAAKEANAAVLSHQRAAAYLATALHQQQQQQQPQPQSQPPRQQQPQHHPYQHQQSFPPSMHQHALQSLAITANALQMQYQQQAAGMGGVGMGVGMGMSGMMWHPQQQQQHQPMPPVPPPSSGSMHMVPQSHLPHGIQRNIPSGVTGSAAKYYH